MLQRRIWARIEGLRQVNHSGKSSKTQRCKSVQRRRYRGGYATARQLDSRANRKYPSGIRQHCEPSS